MAKSCVMQGMLKPTGMTASSLPAGGAWESEGGRSRIGFEGRERRREGRKEGGREGGREGGWEGGAYLWHPCGRKRGRARRLGRSQRRIVSCSQGPPRGRGGRREGRRVDKEER